MVMLVTFYRSKIYHGKDMGKDLFEVGSWFELDTQITILVQADKHGDEAAAERPHLDLHRKERT